MVCQQRLCCDIDFHPPHRRVLVPHGSHDPSDACPSVACCSRQLCFAVQGHQAPVTHVTVNERSNQVISLSKDKIIKVAIGGCWVGCCGCTVVLGWRVLSLRGSCRPACTPLQ